MIKVSIKYATGATISFTTTEVFYKTTYGWMREIGYLPIGKKRKTWYPIGGRHDDNNDYTNTIVTITHFNER